MMPLQERYTFIPEFFINHFTKIPLIRKSAKYANVYLSPKSDIKLRVNGFSMYARTLDRILALQLWKLSLHENYEKRLLKEIVKEKMTVFDIGANIGFYTLLFAELVGNKGTIYSFEPDPLNYRLLVKNVLVNGYQNVHFIEKAISGTIGEVKLYLSDEHTGDHRIYDPNDGRRSIDVKSTTILEVVKETVIPDIIKLDIQGSEFLALTNISHLLNKNKYLKIICEFWPKGMIACGQSPMEFLQFLEKCGFQIFIIDESQSCLRAEGPEKIINYCKGKGYINLLLKGM
ncbi:MAG: hypothetical protein A2V65_11000 [Deltaproteobacteria bacterium RBG_13_49_15]|nr:MAG: hypothetical protein A2V65_11000 [Deltaproteobacteria bacterium RBG_13_49_15]